MAIFMKINVSKGDTKGGKTTKLGKKVSKEAQIFFSPRASVFFCSDDKKKVYSNVWGAVVSQQFFVVLVEINFF